MFNYHIGYYFLLIVSFLFYYIIGSLIFYLAKISITNRYADLFGRVLLGIVFSVVSAAIFFTKGETIMTTFLLIGSFFLIELKKERIFSNHSRVKIVLFPKFSIVFIVELLGVSTLLYFIRYFFSFKSSGIPLDVHPDAIYYAKAAFFIVKSGIENCNFDFVGPLHKSAYPYHYFDLWLTGTLAVIFNTISISTLLLVTYTGFTLLIYIGFCAIHETFRPTDLFAKIFCLLFIFFAGFILFNVDSIPFFANIHVFAVNAVSYPKILPIYIFLIAAALFFLYDKFINAILMLLVLPVVFISTTPSVLSSIGLGLFLFLILNKNKASKKSAIRLVLYTLLIGVVIGGFYLLFGTKENSLHADAGSSILSQAMTFTYWKTAINIVVGAGIQVLILYFIPVVVLIVWILPANIRFQNIDLAWRGAVLFIAFLFISSLGCWAIMHNMVDSVQLFSNLSIPLLHLILFTPLALYLRKFSKNSISGSLIILLLLFSFYNVITKNRSPQTYDDAFLDEVNKAAININPLGVYVKSPSEYNNIFSKNTDFAVLGKYLSFIKSDFHPINISVFDIPIDPGSPTAKIEDQLIRNSAFYKFTNKQKAEKVFVSIGKSQVDFIKEKNIHYLLASKDAVLSPVIKALIKKEIVDNKTGEKFILLK